MFILLPTTLAVSETSKSWRPDEKQTALGLGASFTQPRIAKVALWDPQYGLSNVMLGEQFYPTKDCQGCPFLNVYPLPSLHRGG